MSKRSYKKSVNRQISWSLIDYEREYPKPTSVLEKAADKILAAHSKKERLVSSRKPKKKKKKKAHLVGLVTTGKSKVKPKT